ncbi:MAG TPA: hypothetical protein VMW17_18405 [Candidatus Binatia bacterium]|nr:hypothetical protein [Candidatus Binatia bacterium]
MRLKHLPARRLDVFHSTPDGGGHGLRRKTHARHAGGFEDGSLIGIEVLKLERDHFP